MVAVSGEREWDQEREKQVKATVIVTLTRFEVREEKPSLEIGIEIERE